MNNFPEIKVGALVRETRQIVADRNARYFDVALVVKRQEHPAPHYPDEHTGYIFTLQPVGQQSAIVDYACNLEIVS